MARNSCVECGCTIAPEYVVKREDGTVVCIDCYNEYEHDKEESESHLGPADRY